MIYTWKDIPGFEGFYQVSNIGKIKSLARVVMRKNGSKCTVKERILKTRLNNRGYEIVTLCIDCNFTHHTVHKLVALAFYGERPTGHEIAHFDGVRNNNKVENIRYATKKDNAGDRDRHGNTKRGEENNNAKLTHEIVLAIRNEVGSQASIASKYGISQTNVSQIKRCVTWRDC